MAKNAAPVRRSADPTLEEMEAALKIAESGPGLEQASREQPTVFYRVAKQLALAISERDEAKQAVTELEAEIDLDIRDKAARRDEKTTEGGIKAEVATNAKVVAAKEEFNRLARRVGELSALKESFTQRSYALNHLVDLHIAHFYSSSSAEGAQSRDERRRARVVDTDRAPIRHSRDK